MELAIPHHLDKTLPGVERHIGVGHFAEVLEQRWEDCAERLISGPTPGQELDILGGLDGIGDTRVSENLACTLEGNRFCKQYLRQFLVFLHPRNSLSYLGLVSIKRHYTTN